MAVGTTALECYEAEDVSWGFAVSAQNVDDIAGWTIELVIKASPSEVDPPLIGPIDCDVNGDLTFVAEFNVDLHPGTYVYSVRRVDAGHSTQLAQGSLTVRDSASIDPS